MIIVVSSYDIYKILVKLKFRDQLEFERYILPYIIIGKGGTLCSWNTIEGTWVGVIDLVWMSS